MTTHNPALQRLIEALRRRDYDFVTITPASHARVLARPDRQRARDLRDVLGWSLPFAPDVIDSELLRLLDAAGAIAPAGDGLMRSRYRVSSLKGDLYLHSAYPTDAEDAVFFGPDSYRFADLIEAELAHRPAPEGARIVDIGTGAGVGAIVAAHRCSGAQVVMTDINPKALALAAINAECAGVAARGVESDCLDGSAGAFDLILANPPYIIDDSDRAYRDGGDMLGGRVSFDMAAMALPRLAAGGRMILYSGSAIVAGRDQLCHALAELAQREGVALSCREIDPDVFGEELEKPAYAGVERIALIAAIFTRD